MGEATPLPPLAIRKAAFRRLLTGRPVSIEAVAQLTGLSSEAAHEAADQVVAVGRAEIDDEMIIGIDGLSLRQTQHRIVLSGVALWTWCAYDIVGISAALGANAVGTTNCGMCEREIKVVIRGGRPEGSAAIGWLPDETCCSNIMAEFCPNALLFCSQEHLDEWTSQRVVGPGKALVLDSLANQGRSDWHELVV